MDEKPKKRKPNAGSFKDRDPRIRPLQPKAELAAAIEATKGEIGKPPQQPVIVASRETILDAMRHVFTTPPGNDNYQQAICRSWLKEDRKAFMSRLADLEKAAKPAEKPEERLADEASDRVESLIGEVLDTAKRRTLQARHDKLLAALRGTAALLPKLLDSQDLEDCPDYKAAQEALSESVT